MLSNNTITKLLTLIKEQKILLESYSLASPLYYTEARLTLFEIEDLLVNHKTTLSTSLVNMLKARWQRIQNTNCQYLHDFTSPANTVCIMIASILSKRLSKNNLCLLMPSLESVSPEDYLTSSYTDEDISMQDIILSDNNQRIISVPDVLDSAQEDGILKHNSLVSNKVHRLSLSERNRLHSRHPSITDAFNALTARISYKYNGDTVGAALNRLIVGLNTGGTHENKDEYDAEEFNASEYNAGTDANLAILTFGEYLETLDEETKDKLLSASKTDRFTTHFVEKITVNDSWARLCEPDKKEDEEELATTYCVELIAIDLKEILDENPGLYDLVSYQGQALGDLIKLNENVHETTKKMKEHLTSIQTHYCYDNNDPALAKKLLEPIREKRLPLSVKEFQLFIQMHLSAPNDSILTRKITQIFKNNFYSNREYQKLSPEEKELYFKLNPDHKKSVTTSYTGTLFLGHKRKRASIPVEDEQESSQHRPEKSHSSEKNHRPARPSA